LRTKTANLQICLASIRIILYESFFLDRGYSVAFNFRPSVQPAVDCQRHGGGHLSQEAGLVLTSALVDTHLDPLVASPPICVASHIGGFCRSVCDDSKLAF